MDYQSAIFLVVLFVAAYLSNLHGHSLRGKRGERVGWGVSLLLGLCFAAHSAFLLTVAVSFDGSVTPGVFMALFLTYLLYFAILMFIPSVPLFFLLNKWRPEQAKL